MSLIGRQPYKREKLRPPAEALAIARGLLKDGLYHPGDTELPSELSALGYPGEEMYGALRTAFDEASPEAYEEDPDPHTPPAYIFVWQSEFFGVWMFLKFKLKGTKHKPVLWIYGCHKAHFRKRT